MNLKTTNNLLIFFLGFFGTFSLYGLNSARDEIRRLNDHRVMSMRANNFINNEKSNYALVTAIASSHITTAFEHGNQVSGFKHAHEIDKRLESNWYNYSFDGKTAWDRNRQSITFSDLKNNYERVFYWSNRRQLRLNDDGSSTVGGLKPPNVQFKVIVGRSKPWRSHLNDRDWPEILAELDGYELVSFKDPDNYGGYGFKKKELKNNCDAAKYCYIFNSKDEELHNVNSIALWFKNDFKIAHTNELKRAKDIQKNWQLQGLNKKGNWENLKFIFDDTLIARDSRWVFLTNSKKSYNKFRFLSNNPNDSIVEIRLYAKYKKLSEKKILPTSIFIDKEIGPTKLIQSNFWERKGRFPLSLKKKLNKENYINSYTLGCANYGINGENSTTRMPTSWILLGKTNNKKIVVLDKKDNIPEWKPNEKRTFFLEKKIPNLRELILTVKKPENSNIVRISTFSISNTQFDNDISNNDPSLSENLIKDNFWENTVGFPVSLEREFKSKWEIKAYSLGNTSFGANDIESTSKMPTSWKLYGKSNWRNWILLDTRKDIPIWSPNEKRIYKLKKVPRNLSKFKLLVKKTRDPNIVRISNFSLLSKSGKISNNQVPLNSNSKQKGYFSSFLEESLSELPVGLEMYLSRPEVINSYEINASKFGKESIDRMPKSWKLQAFDFIRNEWVDLHSVENSKEWLINEKRKFIFSNSVEYVVYRLKISELMNNGNILRIGGVDLYKTK
tara:strand:+ start:1894 stop:4080 length:2187 start_codon:yes stop_codon:yes gene_type:complete